MFARGLARIVRGLGRQYAALAKDGKLIPSHVDFLATHVVADLQRTAGPLFRRMAARVLKDNKSALGKLGIVPSGVEAELMGAVLARQGAVVKFMAKTIHELARVVRNIGELYGDLPVREQLDVIQDRVAIAERHAEFIARDQTVKMNGDANEIRQQDAGVLSYIWATSRDDRVRPTHVANEGQEFSWDDPPATGHPGDDYNCRCVPIPTEPVEEEEPPTDEEEPVDETPAPVEEAPIEHPPLESPAVIPEPPPPTPSVSALATLKELGAEVSGAKAMLEKNAKKLFGKEFTPANLRALVQPPPGYTIDFQDISPLGAAIELNANIMKDGYRVGDIQYLFKQGDNGTVVNHKSFFLDSSEQGKGVGETMTRSALRTYKAMGFEKVELTAAEIGQYTWARFGFNWSAEEAMQRAEDFTKYLTPTVGPAKAAAIGQTALTGADAVAAVEVNGQKVGKAFLLQGEQWEGSLPLKDGDRSYEVARKRLGL